MSVTYFRPRRQGPELALEDAVAQSGPAMLLDGDDEHWTAGSLPLGAGMPDLTFVSYDPEVVVGLVGKCARAIDVMAYLRVVHEARTDTIARRTKRPVRLIERLLDELVEAEVVESDGDNFGLSEAMRNALPEVVTVEAKVSHWNAALSQAARNTIFAHYSYVALPLQIARRVRAEPRFTRFGVGILGVNDKKVSLVRRPRRQRPSVWSYYYRLAVTLADNTLGDRNALHRLD